MTVSGFLIAHGSALILPLSIIEGPVVSVVTGLLSADGYFAWYWALPLLICGDLLGDLLYYGAGRLGRGMRRRVSPPLRLALAGNATRILLIGKWTHSLGCLVLIGSGVMRVPLARFVLVNLVATVPKSGLLFGVGYFIGDQLPLLESHSVAVAAGLGVAGLATMATILLRADGVWARR